MSHADKSYFLMMFLAFVITFSVVVTFYVTSLKNYLSAKLTFLTIGVSPFMLLFLFLFIIQLDSVGFSALMSGDFNCSSLHGGGAHRCGIAGALFDALINAVIFSFISFGLFPVAAFAVTLLFLTLINKKIKS